MGYSASIMKLASTIQGEAAGPQAQFAVAATMENRLNSGYSLASLYTVGSYEANNKYTPPTQNAIDLAVAVQNGKVSDYGDTGSAGAIYYNAKGTNAAYDAGGVNIGNNMYSDRYNQTPSTDFRAPSYDPTKAGSSDTQFDAAQDAAQNKSINDAYGLNNGNGYDYTQNNGAAYTPANSYGSGSQFGSVGSQSLDTPQPTGPNGFSSNSIGENGFATSNFDTAQYAQNNGAAYTPNTIGDGNQSTPIFSQMSAGDSTLGAGEGDTGSQFDQIGSGASPSMVSAPAIGSGDVGTSADLTTSGSVSYQDPNVGGLPTGTADSSTGVDAGMDVPSAIDGLAAVLAQNQNAANKSIISAADTTAKASANSDAVSKSLSQMAAAALQKATTQQTSTAQDIRASNQSFATTIFVRAALVVLGLIFVAVALSMFKPVQQVVAPVVNGAKRVGKAALA